MFTGLIEDLGTLRRLRRGGDSVQLTVSTALPTAELQLGDSVAVNGICLTVVEVGPSTFSADVSPETLERSALGRLVPGQRLNLERALRLGDRLGGHLVSGHVDGVGRVLSRERDGNAVRFRIGLQDDLLRYVVDKGSVAVDGVSLTINGVEAGGFSVALIPHSLAKTTLQERQAGDGVNIEVDVIGKYVERLLGRSGPPGQAGGLDLETLAKHGFL